nr:ABC transporter ATP-binding protein [Mesorhizobium loti]
MSSDVMQNSELAIRVQGVSKHYTMFERPEDRFKQMVVPRLQRLVRQAPRRYFRDFAALNDVTLEVGRGETVGIIGRNGSGKSTLLQIICGTLQPTSGRVEVRGRIAALLELGAGFNPEFTGRENVFLNASILGVPRQEMEWRFEDIAKFADIGPFLDQPVKTYSSGMYVRLAFATAINVDPDILVVDEALAVGDEAFQRKCFARIEDIKDKGGTILFVSHAAQTIVQLCTKAFLLDRGEMLLEGTPKTVVSQYQRLINLLGTEADEVRTQIASGEGLAQPESIPIASKGEGHEKEDESWFDPALGSSSVVEYESHGVRISNLTIQSADERPVNVLQVGKTYSLSYDVMFSTDAGSVIFGMQAKTVSGFVLAGANNQYVPESSFGDFKAGQKRRITFTFVCRFLPGVYLVDTGVMAIVNGEMRFAHRILDALMFRVSPTDGLYDKGHFILDARLKLETLDPEKGPANGSTL